MVLFYQENAGTATATATATAAYAVVMKFASTGRRVSHDVIRPMFLQDARNRGFQRLYTSRQGSQVCGCCCVLPRSKTGRYVSSS